MHFFVFQLYVFLTINSTGTTYLYPSKTIAVNYNLCLQVANIEKIALEKYFLKKGLTLEIDYKMRFECRPGEKNI